MYNKTNWVGGETIVASDKMNNMELGVEQAHALKADVSELEALKVVVAEKETIANVTSKITALDTKQTTALSVHVGDAEAHLTPEILNTIKNGQKFKLTQDDGAAKLAPVNLNTLVGKVSSGVYEVSETTTSGKPTGAGNGILSVYPTVTSTQQMYIESFRNRIHFRYYASGAWSVWETSAMASTAQMYKLIQDNGTILNDATRLSMNAYTESGFYRISSSVSNKPNGITEGIVLVFRKDTNAIVQQLISDRGGESIIFYRVSRNNGTNWDNWVSIVTTASIGDLSTLTTAVKTNLVLAINEVSSVLDLKKFDKVGGTITGTLRIEKNEGLKIVNDGVTATAYQSFYGNATSRTTRTGVLGNVNANDNDLYVRAEGTGAKLRLEAVDKILLNGKEMASKDEAQLYKFIQDGGTLETYNGNVNSLKRSGLYYVPSTATNKPVVDLDGVLEVLYASDATIMQRFLTRENELFTRIQKNGVYQPWTRSASVEEVTAAQAAAEAKARAMVDEEIAKLMPSSGGALTGNLSISSTLPTLTLTKGTKSAQIDYSGSVFSLRVDGVQAVTINAAGDLLSKGNKVGLAKDIGVITDLQTSAKTSIVAAINDLQNRTGDYYKSSGGLISGLVTFSGTGEVARIQSAGDVSLNYMKASTLMSKIGQKANDLELQSVSNDIRLIANSGSIVLSPSNANSSTVDILTNGRALQFKAQSNMANVGSFGGIYYINGDGVEWGHISLSESKNMHIMADLGDIYLRSGALRVRNAGNDKAAALYAGDIYGDSVEASSLIGVLRSNSTNVYVSTGERAGGVLNVTDSRSYNGGDIVFRPVYASAFTVRSLESLKKDFVVFQEDALDVVEKTEVYRYNYKNDDFADAKAPKELGLVIGRNTPEDILDEENGAVSMYKMNAFLWRAVQQLAREVKSLRG